MRKILAVLVVLFPMLACGNWGCAVGTNPEVNQSVTIGGDAALILIAVVAILVLATVVTVMSAIGGGMGGRE